MATFLVDRRWLQFLLDETPAGWLNKPENKKAVDEAAAFAERFVSTKKRESPLEPAEEFALLVSTFAERLRGAIAEPVPAGWSMTTNGIPVPPETPTTDHAYVESEYANVQEQADLNLAGPLSSLMSARP